MRAFLLLSAVVLSAIGIGVAAVASTAGPTGSNGESTTPCGALSGPFVRAYSSAIDGLHPQPIDVTYACVTTSRNAALSAIGAGQVGSALGSEVVALVVLKLASTVSANVSTTAVAKEPKGNLITYTFDPTTGAVEDFGISMVNAAHRAPDLGNLGAGSVTYHELPTAAPAGAPVSALGLPSNSRFVAEYGHPGGKVVFEVFSLATGKPLGEVKGSPSGPDEPDGPWRASDGSLWYSSATGPRRTNPGGLECLSFVPNSCTGSITRLDPRSGTQRLLLSAASSEMIDGAVPSPNRELVAYRVGGCLTSYFNQHLVVENLLTGQESTLGANLVACHDLTSPSFSASGKQLVFIYAPSTLPKNSTFEPSTSCQAPGEGELVVAPSDRSSSASSWHPIPASAGCGFTAAVFDTWGVTAVEACGANNLGAARLVQFSPSLERLAQFPLAPGSNPTTLAVNRAGTEVLIDEYEAYHGAQSSAGQLTGPGGLRVGSYYWIDVFNGHAIDVAHRYPNDVIAVDDASW